VGLVSYNVLMTTDHIFIPVNLLMFGMETGITTLTCLVEMLSWRERYGYSGEEIAKLLGVYAPYLLVGTLVFLFYEERLAYECDSCLYDGRRVLEGSEAAYG
jgi:hypothetical protein